MTPDDVRARVAKLATADDPEWQHGEEDRIWRDVLVEVWRGSPDARALADEALKTTNINFQRWYA
jgi:hypothetical protein